MSCKEKLRLKGMRLTLAHKHSKVKAKSKRRPWLRRPEGTAPLALLDRRPQVSEALVALDKDFASCLAALPSKWIFLDGSNLELFRTAILRLSRVPNLRSVVPCP